MTKAEKEIDTLLKTSFSLTEEEKKKYKKEKLTDEEIKILESQMLSSDDSKNTESDLIIER